MHVINQSPVYNLKAVLRETGLKADVLRAWERRYDFPKPQRTAGGHRLYSEYDIESLKWLRARQAEGLSISHAVELWKETIESGLNPLDSYSVGTPPAANTSLVVDTRIETLRQKWLEANLAFDSIQVEDVLNQAFSIYPVETVCTEILQRGISEIGNYWYLDRASVQQEHFATGLATRRLEALLTGTPRPTRQQTVVIGCPPGEMHTIPVLMLSLFISRRGLKVVYLGADVPIERMAETSIVVHADLVVLAAQRLTTAAVLQSAALTLNRQGIPLAYGGSIFNGIPELRLRIPAHFLGETFDAAIQSVERLVVAPAPVTLSIPDNEAYRALGGRFRQKRPLIESRLLENFQAAGHETEHIGEANYFFGNGLSAALDLGDLAFLEPDLEWVKRLLTGRRIPAGNLRPYLAAYSQAMQAEMGEASAPIVEWIDTYMAGT